MSYALCGQVVESDIDLPELPAASGRSTYTVKRTIIDLSTPHRVVRRSRAWHGDDEWLSIARRRDGFLARFTDLADFLIASNGEEILVDARPSVPAPTLRHLLLDQVFPLALSASGHLVMHAAAVAIGGRAVGFLGRAGAGKSTLAASLSQTTGGSVLADDCLLIATGEGRAVAIPSYPGVRLWPDSVDARALGTGSNTPVAHYTEKRRVPVRAATDAGRSTELRRLYLLDDDPGGEVAIEPTRGGAALVALVEQTYRLDPTDTPRAAEEFTRLAALAACCAVKRLSYPRDFSRLEEVHAAIVADLE